MFTGLIETIGTVIETKHERNNLRLNIAAPIARELRAGQSIAVDGVCLTVTAATNESFAIVAVSETLIRTTIAALRAGDKVHLERALSATDRFEGNFVQGHIDCVAMVVRVINKSGSRIVWFRLPRKLMRYVAPQGSLALSGISLTVVDVSGDLLSVALVPHTLQHTLADGWRRGTRVNVEVDIQAKYVVRAQSRAGHIRSSGE